MSLKEASVTAAVNYNYDNDLMLHCRYVEMFSASCNDYITHYIT